MFCLACGNKVPTNAKFCSSCGQAMDSDTGTTLVDDDGSFEGETLSPRASTPRKPPSRTTAFGNASGTGSPNPLTSSEPIGGGRFAPGQILGERYRIVALAGRGGMGEVFRAEDLTLGQMVAMKFLPERLSQDARALARFHAEVRNARQVSHPNVCRVFDIGETDGALFLTMEYVDGEDLASVVRRIGRLSPDKATEIARQICAGLAAAHERGVIHRDLKPANIMLDGEGKIRITDFGLAGIAASLEGEEARAGTPAYMAPEQLAGKQVTTRSDIYSLGLVLYEILTGKRAFEASTLQELVRVRASGTITNPSTLVRDLDPLIERVILRCLETDPDKRPASALQVAAALPGGDPLAAALAAGETPSPEMVAAAGATEGIKPQLGLALIATVLVGLVAHMFLADRYGIQNLTPLEKSPDVLLARSQEITQQLGFSETPGDSVYGLLTDLDYLHYIQEHDQSQARWQRLSSDRPPTMVFWYRQSPREIESSDFFNFAGSVTLWEPPSDITGMISVCLDSRGRRVFFKRIPPEHDPPRGATAPPGWSSLFSAAGLDPSTFTAATPEWADLLYSDTRAAWTREITTPIRATVRVEGAAYRGKPVYFRVLYPWADPWRDRAHQPTSQQKLASIVGMVVFAALLLGSILIVRRNVRQKRGDEAGSWRLANFLFFVFLTMWALQAHHLASMNEFGMIVHALAWAFLISTFARQLYFGLEPFVRRRDPHALIGWARLTSGKIRDPLVGRDILIGTAYGVLLGAFESVDNVVLPLLGGSPPRPVTPSMESLLGVRLTLGSIFRYTWVYVLFSLGIFFLLFLLRLVVKKDWIAAIVIVFLGAVTNTGGDYFWSTFLFAAVIWLSIYLVLRRFGLLALVVGLVVQNTLVTFPMTTHLSRWYAAGAIAGMVTIVAVALFAMYEALAGQPLFSTKALDG